MYVGSGTHMHVGSSSTRTCIVHTHVLWVYGFRVSGVVVWSLWVYGFRVHGFVISGFMILGL